jgi:hypothetical protein
MRSSEWSLPAALEVAANELAEFGDTGMVACHGNIAVAVLLTVLGIWDQPAVAADAEVAHSLGTVEEGFQSWPSLAVESLQRDVEARHALTVFELWPPVAAVKPWSAF